MQDARYLNDAQSEALDDLFHDADNQSVQADADGNLPDSHRCKATKDGVRCRRYHGHDGRHRARVAGDTPDANDDGMLIWK